MDEYWYLEYGEIWREISLSNMNTDNIRRCDQFIQLDSLFLLFNRVKEFITGSTLAFLIQHR